MSESTTPPATGRRLTRSSDDRVVAGVCGGLARYTGIDPVVFRVVVAVAAVLGGSGVLAYLVAWLVIPKDDAPSHVESFVDRRGRDLPKWAAITIGIVVVVAVLSIFDGPWPFFRGGFGLIVVLAIGVWLWVRHDDRPAAPAPPATVAPAPLGVSPAPAATAPAKERSRLALLTLSAVVLVIGGLTVATFLGAELAPEVFPAAALLTVGAGLLVGARWGRARVLVPIGVVLLVVTAAASIVDVPLRGGAGERVWTPTFAELESDYRLVAGHAVLDLRDLDLPAGAAREIEVTVAFGYLEVWVPAADVDVVIDTYVGAGRTEDDAGFELNQGLLRASLTSPPGSPPALTIRAEVGMGRLEVHL
jgi:phage shock protein PspC (stress-responsive transcriptional regulator)